MDKCDSKCSARTLIESEFEKYLKEKFQLKIRGINYSPEEYTAKIRFEHEKGGLRILMCRYKDGRKTDDIEECIKELKPKEILKYKTIYYIK